MTKEKLKSFRLKNIEIKKLQQSIEQLTSISEVQASLLSHTPRGTNESECKILKSIIKLEDAKKKLALVIADFADQMQSVSNCIRSINNSRIRTVFEMRYLHGETFESIASDLHISWRHVHRLHSDGLKEIEGWVDD